MIGSIFANGYLAATPPTNYPDISEKDQIQLTTSNEQDPHQGRARSCFVLERVCDAGIPDNKIRWGEKFFITSWLPGMTKKLYLNSEANPSNQLWGGPTQNVYLSAAKTPNSIWFFMINQEV